MNIKPGIAENLLKLRTEKKLSRKQLSELAGVSDVTIKRIEYKIILNPTIRILSSIAKGLECDLKDLL